MINKETFDRIIYSKPLIIVCILAVSSIIFGTIYYLLHDNTVSPEEIDIFAKNIYAGSDFVHNILFPPNGRHISNAIMYSADFVSDSMNIHPHTFVQTFGAAVRGFLTVILCWLMASSAFLFTRKNILLPFFMLLALGSVLYRILDSSYISISAYSYFYGYLTGLIIYFLFWQNVIRYVTLGTIPERKFLIINCMIAFLLGIANEPVNAASLVTIVLLFRLCFLIFAQKSSWKPLSIINKFKQLGINVYLPLLFLIAGSVLFCMNPALQSAAGEKFSLDSVQAIKDFIQYFPSFLLTYIKVVFWNNKVHFLILIFLTVLILFYGNNKDKDRRFVFISWSLISGMCAFLFALIFFGKNFPFDPKGFWLYNSDYISVFTICLFTAILSFFGYLFGTAADENNINSDKVKIWIAIILVIITVRVISVSNHIAEDYNRKIYELNKQRDSLYLSDKMYIYYSLKKMPVILPVDTTNSHALIFMMLGAQNPEMYGKEQKSVDSFQNTVIYDKDFWNIYMNAVYKIKGSDRIIFLPEEKAIQHYLENGGKFYKDEIDESNFQNLLNPNFVLNGK